MLGLVIKDFRLLLGRKITIIMFLVLTISLSMTMDMPFVVNYATLLMSILSIGTIAYDEQNNGMSYLMTLPIDSKKYVGSKFVMSFGVSGLVWVLAVSIYAIADVATGMNSIGFLRDFSLVKLGELAAPALIIFVVTAISIPLELKFGAEKFRLVLAVICGGTAALGYAIYNLISTGKFLNEKTVEEIVKKINDNPEIVCAVGVILAIIIIVISFLCSIRIMNKKEY